MIVRRLKSDVKGSGSSCRHRSIAWQHELIEGKVIVQPLKSTLKATPCSSGSRSIPRQRELIEGNVIVRSLRSALRGTRWFLGSRSIPHACRPIEGKMIAQPLKNALKWQSVMDSTDGDAYIAEVRYAESWTKWFTSGAEKRNGSIHSFRTLNVGNDLENIRPDNIESKPLLSITLPSWPKHPNYCERTCDDHSA
jgi:hypothetical protein